VAFTPGGRGLTTLPFLEVNLSAMFATANI
jgi:hypothetical protein